MSVPKYCKQKIADKAYCRINDGRIYLGVYDSAESKTKYANLIGPPKRVEAKPESTTVDSAPPYPLDPDGGIPRSSRRLLRRLVKN